MSLILDRPQPHLYISQDEKCPAFPTPILTALYVSLVQAQSGMQ